MEISLSVKGELAEAVADVLARFAPNGVVTEQGVMYRNAEDEGTPEGPITICAYLPADENLEQRRRSIEEALGHLRMIQTLPAPAFKLIPDQDWMEAWKRHYRPIPIGRRLIIMPAWLEPPPAGRVAIRIDPGMAFGTGTHPTTQLCLEILETLLDPEEPAGLFVAPEARIAVIDVGCGSGILSIAALLLGAASAVAVDIDEHAIENARENARINGIGRQLELGVGSVEEILGGGFSVKSAKLVLANILAPVIIRLFDAGLADLVDPGGLIALSGILAEQADEVVAAAQAYGLHLRGQRHIEDWIALLMDRPGA